MLTGIILAAVLAQAPAPAKAHQPHKSLGDVVGGLLRGEELLNLRIEDLERKVAAMESDRCRCRREAPAPPASPPAPAAPTLGWANIGGVDYYGYRDGAVFRYTAYRVPVQYLPSGCSPGYCGR